jgi:hypothetical protein
MLSNGRSKENLHQGSTKIASGDLEIDGDLIAYGNAEIKGDLTVDGTINGGSSLVEERIAISRWFTQQQSLLNFSAYTGIFLNSNTGDSTTIGNNVIPASDFTITDENYSILHIQFILRINTTDIVQPNQFQVRLRLDDGVSNGTIEFEVMELAGTIQTDSERIMDVYLTFIRNPADPTKINVSNQTLKHTNAISTTAPTTTNTDKLFLSNNQFKIGSETGDISMLLPTTKGYFCQFNNYATGRPLTITMACQRPNPNAFNTIDYGVLMGQLITYKKQSLPSGGTPLNDHLLLTNLNGGTGDGGHINLYDRRGIKPMTGAMNMNQNQINNCLVVNNQAGQPLNLIGGSNVSSVILDATPTQGVIIGSNVGSSTDITGDTSLSLRSNAGSIDLFPSSVMGVVIGGLPRFAVDASEVNVGNSLNMNNNNINNVLNVNSASSIILNPAVASSVNINGNVDMVSNNIIGVSEVVGDGGDMTIRSGGESILLNSVTNTIDILNNNLNMNNNDILNAGDVALTSINTNIIYVADVEMLL